VITATAGWNETGMVLGDIVLVGFGAVQNRRYMPAFRRNILSPSSDLKKETLRFSSLSSFRSEEGNMFLVCLHLQV
jgi:hypothetical protein